MRIVAARAAVTATAAMGLFVIGLSMPAAAQGVVTSSTGIAGTLASQGSGTTFGPVATVVGSGVKPFNKGASVPLFSESLGIVSAGAVIGSTAVVTSGIVSHVSSNGVASATEQAESNTSIASIQVTMGLNAPLGGSAPPPLLALAATNVTAQVVAGRTSPLVVQQTGTVNFGSLTLSGSLLGSQTLTFNGPAPPNTVLYDDARMTVTLNPQELSGAIVCTPVCQFVPKKMTASAVEIEFFQKPIAAKKTINGHLTFGQNVASVP